MPLGTAPYWLFICFLAIVIRRISHAVPLTPPPPSAPQLAVAAAPPLAPALAPFTQRPSCACRYLGIYYDNGSFPQIIIELSRCFLAVI